MIKNIILDMGNVLIEYDVNRPLDALCPNEESKKIIRRELFESEDWLEGDRGNITDMTLIRFPGACLRISTVGNDLCRHTIVNIAQICFIDLSLIHI